MKMLSTILLCVLLVGLCACGLTETEYTSTTATAEKTTTADIITKYPSTAESSADPNDPYFEVLQSASLAIYALHDIDGDGTDFTQYKMVKR